MSLVAVVNGVVGSVGDGDQVVGIEETVIASLELFECDRIQVMDAETTMDLEPIEAEVTSVVSNDDSVTSLTPFTRCVEALVHPAVEPERRLSDVAFQSEVTKAFLERF